MCTVVGIQLKVYHPVRDKAYGQYPANNTLPTIPCHVQVGDQFDPVFLVWPLLAQKAELAKGSIVSLPRRSRGDCTTKVSTSGYSSCIFLKPD